MKKSTITIDLLPTTPSFVPFFIRVKALNLSSKLEEKVLKNVSTLDAAISCKEKFPSLTKADEKELATEMLLYRHKFTELAFQSTLFRQASLTIIQNIYLFQNRKIFFGTFPGTPEMERQDALILFSRQGSNTGMPLAKTFQHLILARIWNRILSISGKKEIYSFEFTELHDVVERLNSLRNIYMILCHGLVHKLVKNISAVYRGSISYEDAAQIGSFGIARAAYRYHQSQGFRFSTFAASWVFKEIQRQALQGRLIKISADTVEQYAKAAREGNEDIRLKIAAEIAAKTAILPSENGFDYPEMFQSESSNCPVTQLEAQQLQAILLQAIDQILTQKSGDVLKRRYGLPPYRGQKQSVRDISSLYGVTRGSIYQLEQSAFKKLRGYLTHAQ